MKHNESEQVLQSKTDKITNLKLKSHYDKRYEQEQEYYKINERNLRQQK